MKREIFESKSISQKLYITNKVMSNYLYKYLTYTVGDKITHLEGRILSFIDRENKKGVILTSKDVTDHFNVTKVSISKAINSLVEKGLVEFQMMENDRRCKMLIMTKLGKKTTLETSKIFSALDKKLTSSLSEEERKIIDDILFKLITTIEEAEDEKQTK